MYNLDQNLENGKKRHIQGGPGYLIHIKMVLQDELYGPTKTTRQLFSIVSMVFPNEQRQIIIVKTRDFDFKI